jgi:hypothetical protein
MRRKRIFLQPSQKELYEIEREKEILLQKQQEEERAM